MCGVPVGHPGRPEGNQSADGSPLPPLQPLRPIIFIFLPFFMSKLSFRWKRSCGILLGILFGILFGDVGLEVVGKVMRSRGTSRKKKRNSLSWISRKNGWMDGWMDGWSSFALICIIEGGAATTCCHFRVDSLHFSQLIRWHFIVA